LRRFLMGLVGVSAAAALMLGAVGTAAAGPPNETTIVQTMDQLASQPANGLSFEGVTFKYTENDVASVNATYNALNGGEEKYVQDPSLEGDGDGILTLTFAQPTHIVQFGVARSVFTQLKPGAVVMLYGANGKQIGTYNVNTEVYFTFSEGLFSYDGSVPATKAVITFPDPDAAFAIDNLTYRS
jgi:hypothetical protein